jgi:phage shock protein PspC (stress-responsive transcriptional regulator)
MNEVTRIHLGRESYTIAVEAHKDLKKYLADIEQKVHDQDVVNEIELRMSELLIERGVTSEKVILPEDVEYLKEQLGSPIDFSDEDDTDQEKSAENRTTKRLFRDTDNAVVAGVAAGIANYTGLDAVLIRVIFVLLTIFGGGIGVVAYLLLWLLVPEAETASEKLQMHGMQVTLESLKKSVSNADVAGATRRVNNTIISAINGLFRATLKIIGAAFVLSGAVLFASIVVTKMYMMLHDGRLFQENLFPVGTREQWLTTIALILLMLVATLLVLIGIAAFKRKWPIRGWITGVLVGTFLLGSAASVALTADTVPRVRERYEATLHTTAISDIQPFTKVVTTGQIDVAYTSAPTYAVNLHYSDHPDLSKVKISVKDNTLYIDSSALDTAPHCNMLCLFPRYNMTVEVYAPNVQDFTTPPSADVFYPGTPALN